jgi:hypothetical protein
MNLEDIRGVWTGFNRLRQRQVAGSCKNGTAPSVSIKYAEFLDTMRSH